MFENSDGNRQMHSKVLPFSKLSRIYAWNITIFVELAHSFEKNTPFFAKMGTSMDVHFGRECGGGGASVIAVLCNIGVNWRRVITVLWLYYEFHACFRVISLAQG